MSRLANKQAACQETQEILRQLLPELKRASSILGVQAGFCGTPPDSALASCVRQIERLSKMSFQEILAWSHDEAGD